MSKKTPASISATITTFILILLAVVFVLLQMIALNGASERQGVIAMGIGLACQSITIILLGTFAARTTDFLIKKVSWDRILAITITVIVTTTIGGTISFLVSFIAILAAGIR